MIRIYKKIYQDIWRYMMRTHIWYNVVSLDVTEFRMLEKPWLRVYLDDEDPLDDGETKAGEGTVASGHRVKEAEGQEQAEPVEEERNWAEIEPTRIEATNGK